LYIFLITKKMRIVPTFDLNYLTQEIICN
jgi:hypothetical protein